VTYQPLLSEDFALKSALDPAIHACEEAKLVFDNAKRRDPLFGEKARVAFLQYLAVCPGKRASGEDLVDYARLQGVIPHDDRAFGSVFSTLARRGEIKRVGFTARRKGNGAGGAAIWEFV
jgi:hypothetical protein